MNLDTLALMRDEARELHDYMSDLSEAAYCAGRMNDLEQALWKTVLGGPRQYGNIIVDDKSIERLKELSQDAVADYFLQ
jgi:hypothetical protein